MSPVDDGRLSARASRALNKPYYLLRPTQVARRLSRRGTGAEHVTVRLPWGSRIRVRPRDLIGGSITRTGVYDLCVSEALTRLIEPGDLVVDVGANIGYMTNLCAVRVGAAGRVIAIEPHPEIFEELRGNVALLKESGVVGQIDTIRAAVSDMDGEAAIVDDAHFAANRGTAQLHVDQGTPASGSRSHRVLVRTLDELLENQTRVGVLKIDVEDHELRALHGSASLLRDKRIRDLIFEEHREPPTPVTDLLEENGFQIFRLRQRFLGLVAEPLGNGLSRSLWDPPSYVATSDAERACQRLTGRGWKTLRSPRR